MTNIDYNFSTFDMKAVADQASKADSVAGGGKGLNWLAAIAVALGKIQGETAGRMIQLVDELSKNAEAYGKLAGQDSTSATDKKATLAAEANVLNAQLQGESQMFKIQSETTSTVIKAIGEGNSSVARKQ